MELYYIPNYFKVINFSDYLNILYLLFRCETVSILLILSNKNNTLLERFLFIFNNTLSFSILIRLYMFVSITLILINT